MTKNTEALADELTRPIIGIENRTAQEVFDIMADRFRSFLRTPPSPVTPITEEAGWQPIETYEKKDNSPEVILLWGRYWSDDQGWMTNPLVGQWVPHLDRFEVFARVPFGIRPTHWRPFPEPPSLLTPVEASGEGE